MKVKAGDTHTVQWTANMDLTGATVRLIANTGRGEPIILPAVITDAAGGIVTHTLTGTLAVNTYRVELEVTASGTITTFPNDGYASLTVIADLD